MNVIHSVGMRALPPFDGLIAFDAALRHRSMTRAAGELGLTQSAISHRLKKLEGFVGTRLLDRTGGGLLPTAAGVTLAEGLGRLLDEMAELRARSRASVRPLALKIGLGSALANYWLVRRLPAFASAYPEIAIELCIVEGDVQARALDLDVQIRWLPKAGARATSTQRLLFDEMVFPVASPVPAAARAAIAGAARARHFTSTAQGPRRPERRRGMVVAGVVRTTGRHGSRPGRASLR